MIPYRKEKIENAICYFATEHRKKSGNPLYQTFLYKYLAFLDFESLQKRGRPSLCLTYIALEKGPVPDEIYNRWSDFQSKIVDIRSDQEGRRYVVCKEKADLSYFSKAEIALMNNLIEIYAKSYIPSKLISDASHERIAAWIKAYKKKPGSRIDYSLTFDEDLFNKPHEKLSFAEESYLTYKAIDDCN